MAESLPQADEATLYVLGLLGRRERRKFEARLKNSSELRALVRALETGAVALSMAVPRRDPPMRVWQGIQTAIAHESEKRIIASVFGSRWTRAALAVAACAMFGWVAYVLWFNRAAVVNAPPQVAVHQSAEDPGHIAANPTVPEARRVAPKSPTARKASRQPPVPLSTPPPSETATVRQRISDLESQVAYLSQALTQQQVLPPGFERVTFFNFGAASPDGASSQGPTPTPSPELRRALLLALARQWGWLPSLDQNQNQQPAQAAQATREQGTQGAPRNEQRNPPATQIESGIAFVDLAPVNSDSPNLQSGSTQPPIVPETPPETSTLSSASESGVTSSASIPGFVSGTNMVLAFDSSVLPSGADRLAFSTIENGRTVFQGSLLFGGTPTVVSMPLAGTWSGGTRTLTGLTPGQPVVLQVRTWDSTTGATFDGVMARGLSTTFTYTIPQTPAPPPAP